MTQTDSEAFSRERSCNSAPLRVSAQLLRNKSHDLQFLILTGALELHLRRNGLA